MIDDHRRPGRTRRAKPEWPETFSTTRAVLSCAIDHVVAPRRVSRIGTRGSGAQEPPRR
jgi:hypothetical protein